MSMASASSASYYVVGEWSDCGQWGYQSRSIQCSTGNWQDCVGLEYPASQQQCEPEEPESSNYGSMNYGSTNYGSMDHSNYGSMNYGSTDYGSMNYGSMDHSNYGSMNYGSTDRSNYGSMNYGSMDHSNDDYSNYDDNSDYSRGGVLCDGQHEGDYCDCEGDCGGSFCQCADALACCDGTEGGDEDEGEDEIRMERVDPDEWGMTTCRQVAEAFPEDLVLDGYDVYWGTMDEDCSQYCLDNDSCVATEINDMSRCINYYEDGSGSGSGVLADAWQGPNAVCTVKMYPEDEGEPCESHEECGEEEFCYAGNCSSCEECEYCQDGVDDTCGSCGEGYPTMEDRDCLELGSDDMPGTCDCEDGRQGMFTSEGCICDDDLGSDDMDGTCECDDGRQGMFTSEGCICDDGSDFGSEDGQDDMVYVNHVHDNPGFYSCAYVSGYDGCLSMGDCVREPLCPDVDGQEMMEGSDGGEEMMYICPTTDGVVLYAHCCDGDGSCTDGDDDYCCGEDYYCSNDGRAYAEGMGGILCPGGAECSCDSGEVYDNYADCAREVRESGVCENRDDMDEDECVMEDECFDEYAYVIACQYGDENCNAYQECPECASAMNEAYECYLDARTGSAMCVGLDDEVERDEDGNTDLDNCAMSQCMNLITMAEDCETEHGCDDDSEEGSDSEGDCPENCLVCDGPNEGDCRVCARGYELVGDDDNDGYGYCEPGDDIDPPSGSDDDTGACLEDCWHCQDERDDCLWSFDPNNEQSHEWGTFDCDIACTGEAHEGSDDEGSDSEAYWRTGEWSDCEHNYRHRTLECSTGMWNDCDYMNMPASYEYCEEGSGSGSDDGSATCGCEYHGYYFCNHDDGEGMGGCEECHEMDSVEDCRGGGLSTSGQVSCAEYCFDRSEPFWATSDWSDCDGSYMTRTVECSTGNWNDCDYRGMPMSYEYCTPGSGSGSSEDGDYWVTTEWSECQNGYRYRSVSCSSNDWMDCYDREEMPSSYEQCETDERCEPVGPFEQGIYENNLQDTVCPMMMQWLVENSRDCHTDVSEIFADAMLPGGVSDGWMTCPCSCMDLVIETTDEPGSGSGSGDDEVCGKVIELPGDHGQLYGSTEDETNVFNPECGGDGPEVIYSIEVPAGATLHIQQTTNNYDSRHILRYGGECPGRMMYECIDDPDTRPINYYNYDSEPQMAYFIIDAYSRGKGSFEIMWELDLPETSTEEPTREPETTMLPFPDSCDSYVCDSHWNMLVEDIAEKFASMTDSLNAVTGRMDDLAAENDALRSDMSDLQHTMYDQQGQIDDLTDEQDTHSDAMQCFADAMSGRDDDSDDDEGSDYWSRDNSWYWSREGSDYWSRDSSDYWSRDSSDYWSRDSSDYWSRDNSWWGSDYYRSDDGYRSDYGSTDYYRSDDGYRSDYGSADNYRSDDGYRSDYMYGSADNYGSDDGYRSDYTYGSASRTDNYRSDDGYRSDYGSDSYGSAARTDNYRSDAGYGSSGSDDNSRTSGRWGSRRRTKQVKESLVEKLEQLRRKLEKIGA